MYWTRDFNAARIRVLVDWHSWAIGVTHQHSPGPNDPIGQRHTWEIEFGPLSVVATWAK
jgi:hypothetical protein